MNWWSAIYLNMFLLSIEVVDCRKVVEGVLKETVVEGVIKETAVKVAHRC